MKLRVMIVDDEPLARERIRMLLRDEADVEIAGEAEDGPAAAQAIAELAPDVVFLDIQMPGMDGFEVLRSLPPERLPVVIFTTAYDQHALRAFEAHALDYLLKPVKPARFREAVARARDLLRQQRAGAAAQGLLDLLGQTAGARISPAPPSAPSAQWLTRFTVKSGEKVIVLRAADVDSIESAGNYVVLHAGKDQHIVRDTLSAMETQLDPARFFRVSRGSIVNLDRVKEIQPMFRGEHVVVLQNGRTIPMTRRLKEVERALSGAVGDQG